MRNDYLFKMHRLSKTQIVVIFCLILSFTKIESQVVNIEPIEKTHFVYYFDNPSYIEFADSILTKSRKKMIELLKDSLSYKPSIYLVGNLNDFNQLVSGRFPDWGIGAAIPDKKRIVIKSPDNFNLNKSLEQLLAHEYAHLAVSHKSYFTAPPRWLNEGVAIFISMEWSWSENIAMGKAAVFNQLIDLREIENVNRFHEGKAQVAYAESYLAVRFLLKYYGKNALYRYLDELNRTKSLDSALYATTGSSMNEFQKDFNDSLHKQFNYASLFMDTIFFWIALAGIVVYAFFLQFKKRREYYKKWEEEEKLASTDFDYGDPDNPEHIDDDDDEAWQK